MRTSALGAAILAGLLALGVPLAGQSAGTPSGPGLDLAGYWSVLSHQDAGLATGGGMIGDFGGIPLNEAGRMYALAWDASRMTVRQQQCPGYVKIDTDAGSQTRVFSFPPAPAVGGAWQGTSTAQWEVLPGLRGQAPLTGSLKVVTTNLKPGYLRKNGVPYSAKTTLTEYFDRITQPNGDAHLIITTTIEDPEYLTQPYIQHAFQAAGGRHRLGAPSLQRTVKAATARRLEEAKATESRPPERVKR